ncbi:MAG: uracil-DNA glycosylase [Chthonomonas sp.]|nr:uracil-DNA glycosylase [Chthonomonas sp.]
MNLLSLNKQIIGCTRCPRLRTWCETKASERRAAFAGQEYWGKPVPNFGDPNAELLIVGLAPAAHGANRTGRMFTGDRSGDWLYDALHAIGLASQPNATDASDGLTLQNVLITAVAHCAPPENKPSKDEIGNCSEYLSALLEGRDWKGILCLGAISWRETHRLLKIRPLPPFAHGAETGGRIIGCYHPSQQNTFTGRLTREMLRSQMQRLRDLAD